jgi:hypothetical protein
MRTLLNGKRARYSMNCFQKTPRGYLVKAAVRDRSFRCSRPLFCLPSKSPGLSVESRRLQDNFAARTQRATLEAFANSNVLQIQRPLTGKAPISTINTVPFWELRRQFARFARVVEINSDRWLGVSMHCPRLKGMGLSVLNSRIKFERLWRQSQQPRRSHRSLFAVWA